MAVKLDTFVFDRGIDRIIRSDARDAGLPDAAHLPPSDLAGGPELDKVLGAAEPAGLPGRCACSRRSPTRHCSPRRVSSARCATRSTRSPAPPRRPAPDATRALSRAQRLLKEEAGLRELVDMYRSALFQG